MLDGGDWACLMVRKKKGRQFALGLLAALFVNATLITLMVLERRDVALVSTTETGFSLKLQLTRELSDRFKTDQAKSKDKQSAMLDRQSSRNLRDNPTAASSQIKSIAKATPKIQNLQPTLSEPSVEPGAKTGVPQDDSAVDADLHARTALALRRLGACSRLNSGTGDLQDKALCTRNYAAAGGATIDTMPAAKRADYDAAHAKAGYLIPADAANPDFVVSEFKRGGTVVTGHARCDLVHGQWQCAGR